MRNEGLRLARLMMVLSSLTPLYLLWSVRGVSSVPDGVLWLVCGGLILLPNLLLALRLRVARTHLDVRALVVGQAEDHRDHLLVYLFAVLLPLFDTNLGGTREAAATIAAFLFVVFLFWHLNLHYMNVLFALRGYRVFTIEPPVESAPVPTSQVVVLLTRRMQLRRGDQISVFRISDTVYIEREESP